MAAVKTAEAATAIPIEVDVMHSDEFGKDSIKKWGVSPDAFVQMAFQLAYYRIHQKPAPTYESCAVRRFLHGRTETIRSLHTQSASLAMGYDTAEPEQQVELLRTAAQAQSEVSALAAKGMGVDRHLYALQVLSAARGGPEHPLFSEELYAHSGTWHLSTSNVTSETVKLFGFGPACTDGYGLGYTIQPDSVTCTISRCVASNFMCHSK